MRIDNFLPAVAIGGVVLVLYLLSRKAKTSSPSASIVSTPKGVPVPANISNPVTLGQLKIAMMMLHSKLRADKYSVTPEDLGNVFSGDMTVAFQLSDRAYEITGLKLDELIQEFGADSRMSGNLTTSGGPLYIERTSGLRIRV